MPVGLEGSKAAREGRSKEERLCGALWALGRTWALTQRDGGNHGRVWSRRGMRSEF